MVALKANDVEGLLKTRDANAFLIFGPDESLVGNAARRLVEALQGLKGRDCECITLEASKAGLESNLIVTEIESINLFGLHKIIRLTGASEAVFKGIGEALVIPVPGITVVLESGNLSKASPLRQAFEQSPRARALALYDETSGSISALVDSILASHQVRIDGPTRSALLKALENNATKIRNQVTNLALYAASEGAVTQDHITAVLGDTAQGAFDKAVDAAFLGETAQADGYLSTLEQENADINLLLNLALRHALLLARLQEKVGEQGPRSHAGVVAAAPGLHFKRKAAVEAQLKAWRSTELERCIFQLQGTLLNARRMSKLGWPICRQALLDVSRTPGRKQA